MCLLTCLLLGCEIKLESCSRSLFSSGSGTSNKQSLPKSKKLDTSSSTKRTTCLDTNAVSSSVGLRIYYLSRHLDASLAFSCILLHRLQISAKHRCTSFFSRILQSWAEFESTQETNRQNKKSRYALCLGKHGIENASERVAFKPRAAKSSAASMEARSSSAPSGDSISSWYPGVHPGSLWLVIWSIFYSLQ